MLKKWARLNGLSLEEHFRELVKEDVKAIVRAVNQEGFDALFGLNLVSVAVASELEGEEIGRYAPFLEGVGMEPELGRISVRDNKLERIAEVTLMNQVWFCDLDNNDSCVHIGFALALLRVRELMSSLQPGG